MGGVEVRKKTRIRAEFVDGLNPMLPRVREPSDDLAGRLQTLRGEGDSKKIFV